MLVIRSMQMAALKQYMLDQFVKDATTYLRQSFPEDTSSIDQDSLTELAYKGIEQSQKYGITDKDNVLRYMECMMIHGEDFDTSEETKWAGEILRREDLSGSEKMDVIDWHELMNPEES